MLDSIARLRRFNRVVTREIGALDTSYLGRGRPLGAARVLQLVRADGTDVADLRQRLDLDTGLLSRLLRSLEREGLVQVVPDPADRRRRIARLTPAGQAEMQVYDALGHAKAQEVFERAGQRRDEVIAAMDLIATVMLRGDTRITDADPGDPAVLHCTAAYRDQLVALVPGFRSDYLPIPLTDAARCRAPDGACLVAWSEDLPVGTVSVRRLDATTAEIKRLWVDPLARGQGLGRRLMRAIETRARDMGYAHARLDTNAALAEAVALYRSDGWTDCAPYTGAPANVWMAKRL
jgi:DNA-binding MarR family transcriptional regulator/predicted GNAT family acetyltransferase